MSEETITITWGEVTNMLGMKVTNYQTDYVNGDIVPKHWGEYFMGDVAEALDNWPDSLMAYIIRRLVISSATAGFIRLEPGEMNIEGEIYTGGFFDMNPELSIISRASLPGMILDELCRRLENAIRYDEAQQANQKWEPPEPWPPGDTDDSPAAD